MHHLISITWLRIVAKIIWIVLCLGFVRGYPVLVPFPDDSNDLFVPDGQPDAVEEIPASEGAPPTSVVVPEPVNPDQSPNDPIKLVNFDLIDLGSAGLRC